MIPNMIPANKYYLIHAESYVNEVKYRTYRETTKLSSINEIIGDSYNAIRYLYGNGDLTIFTDAQYKSFIRILLTGKNVVDFLNFNFPITPHQRSIAIQTICLLSLHANALLDCNFTESERHSIFKSIIKDHKQGQLEKLLIDDFNFKLYEIKSIVYEVINQKIHPKLGIELKDNYQSLLAQLDLDLYEQFDAVLLAYCLTKNK